MALEQVFECPRTLRRLRSSPLGKLMEGFCSWMLEYGFSRSTIRKHLFRLSHLTRHLDNPECGIRESITTREVKASCKAYSLQCQKTGAREKHIRRVGYSVHRFLQYLRDSGLLDLSAPFGILSHVDARLPARFRWNAQSPKPLHHSLSSMARPRSHARRLVRAHGRANRRLLSQLCSGHGPISTPLHAVGSAELPALLCTARL